jgi:hypothetical protein
MRQGRLQGEREALNSEARCVFAAAQRLAGQQHRAVTLDDLRHGLHLVAIGKARSHKDFSNADFSKYLNTAKLVIDETNLGAAIKAANPELIERENIEWQLRHRCYEAYVRGVSSDIYGSTQYELLETWQLKALYQTLRGRAKAWKPREEETGRRGDGEAAMAGAAGESNPF